MKRIEIPQRHKMRMDIAHWLPGDRMTLNEIDVTTDFRFWTRWRRIPGVIAHELYDDLEEQILGIPEESLG